MKVKISDLYNYSQMFGVKWSPDGKYAAFGTKRATEFDNSYDTRLWLYNAATGKVSPLTAGPKDGAPIWLDETHVAFTRRGAKKEGAAPSVDYYQISVLGGEAEKLFSVPGKVNDLQKLADGRFLVCFRNDVFEKEETKEGRAEARKDYLVFEEIPFWGDGLGIINRTRVTLGIFDPATGKVENITPKYFETTGYSVPYCGKYILYTGREYTDKNFRTAAMYIYRIRTGETITLVEPGVTNACHAQYIGDHKVFYGYGNHTDSHSNARHHIMDLRTREDREINFLDISPSGFKVDNDTLYMLHPHYSGYAISVLEGDSARVMMAVPGLIEGFDIKDGKGIMTMADENGLSELYTFDTCGNFRKISSINDEFLRTHEVSKLEKFTFTNKDGYMLEGFVLKPYGYVPGTRYPGILEIHGGPKGVYDQSFNHEMQAFAAAGYFVFFTNPRGSDGRGEDFADLTGKLCTIDYNDIMELTDQVLERYPDIDPKRVGVMGGSYGGLMCNWIIGHTDRFAAAASQRSISNYMTKCLTTDIGYLHNLSQICTDPWHGFDAFWSTSPLKSAHNCTTPTLFIQSDQDYRCWMSDAVQMFTALQMKGVDSKICLFKGESHGLSRIGRPKNRVGRLTEMLNWMDKYCK